MNYQYPAGVPLTRQNSASPFQQAGLIPSMNLPMGYPGMMAPSPMMVQVGQPMMHPMMAQPPMMVQVGQPMMQPVVQPIVAQQFAVGVQQTIIQTPDRDPGDPRPGPSGGSAAARDTNRSPPPGPAPDPSPPSRGSDGSLIVKSGVANPGEYLTKQVMPKDKNSIGQALIDENIGIQKYDQVSVVEQVNQNQGLAEDMKGFAVDADFRLYYSVFDATAKRVLLKSQRLQKSGNPVLPNDDLMCHPHSHAKSCVPTCFCCQWPTGDLPTFSAILKGEQLLIQYESDIVKIVEAKIAKNGDPKRVFTTLERMALPHSACCFPLFFLPCLFCCGKYKSFVLEFQLLESNAVAASSPLNRTGSNIAQGTRASLGASNRASGVSSRSTAVEGES